MTTRTLKLTHTASDTNFVLKNEIQFSFVSLEDMRKIVWWIGNVIEGKVAAKATTDTGEYQFIRFVAECGKFDTKEAMYAAFMAWIRFVFADMYIDE